MKSRRKLSLLASLVVVSCLTPWDFNLKSFAVEPASRKKEMDLVQSQVREISSAVYAGDADGVLKHSHPKIIAMLGGQDAAKPLLEQMLKKLLANGMKMEEMTFPAAPSFLTGTENEFVIVPTRSIIVANEKRGESLNFQFGARPIGSTRWSYIEGSRINSDNVRKLFPDFPRDFAFPAISRKLIEPK